MQRLERARIALNAVLISAAREDSARADWASAPGNAAPLGLIGRKNRENREKRYDPNLLDFAASIRENGRASSEKCRKAEDSINRGSASLPTPLMT